MVYHRWEIVRVSRHYKGLVKYSSSEIYVYTAFIECVCVFSLFLVCTSPSLEVHFYNSSAEFTRCYC